MDQRKRREINTFADAVREYIGLEGPPYDVAAAVEKLGGKLVELTDGDALLSEEASVRRRGEAFEIRVAKAPERRRRFSIAHELGHLFLHMGFKVDEAKWANSSGYDVMNRFGNTAEEYEAHEFAGAFLMPERDFRVIARRHLEDGQYDMDAIASHFRVSVHAALTRGRWLGLFAWS